MELKDLKKEYESLRNKHKLPSFQELNEDFEVDKIDKENDTLLRVVRKVMMDKIIYALSFTEMLLNPVNAPRVYFMYIKNMTSEDKETLDKIYDVLGELNLLAFNLEISYSEEKEAEQIRRISQNWGSVKPLFGKIFDNMLVSLKSNDIKKEKSYFG